MVIIWNTLQGQWKKNPLANANKDDYVYPLKGDIHSLKLDYKDKGL